jgi:hypothetical protein
MSNAASVSSPAGGRGRFEEVARGRTHRAKPEKRQKQILVDRLYGMTTHVKDLIAANKIKALPKTPIKRAQTSFGAGVRPLWELPPQAQC